MAPPNTERARIRNARGRLDAWKYDARDRAYAELFEGPDAVLDDDDLLLLDLIDSDLTRRGRGGLWDADEYGVIVSGAFETREPRVVCTYHPEIPVDGFRGEGRLSETERDDLNDVLWDYAERVAAIVQEDLDAFLRSSRRE